MKTKYIAFAIIIIIVVVTAGVLIAGSKKRSADITGLTYQQLCGQNSDEWMVMEPWVSGKKITEETCAGCMIGDNHFCTSDEYIEYIKSLPGFKTQQSVNENMRMMMHEAMTASAGYQNSVNIHTYKAEFLRDSASSEIAFKITEDGKPVSDLEVAHDKIMHVILVRDDLKYFDHIHPQPTTPGVFSVPYEFRAPGRYRIWTDFTIDGMQHIVDFDLNVSVETKPEPDKLLDTNVAMDISDNLKVDETAKIEFTVSDSNGPVTITEKFLAANAHMVIIDETLEEFGHTHDESFDKDNILSFEYKFMRPGLHKLWAQFSVNGTERTAEFVVNVNE